jgi:hypothetical protein
MSRSASLLASFVALASLLACGSGSGGSGGGVASSTSSSSSGAASSSSSGSSSSSSGGPVTMCSEIGAADCFSNYDCALSSDRCENVGTADVPVACCVPGPRGTGMGGDPCQSEDDCASGVCLVDTPSPGTNLCSQLCSSDADCPADLPSCVTLVAGANGSFCF